MSRRILHAYYSAKDAERHGTAIYMSIPDLNEQSVLTHVTCVDEDKKWIEENYMWPDKIYLGRVSDHCLGGTEGSEPLFHDWPRSYPDYP